MNALLKTCQLAGVLALGVFSFTTQANAAACVGGVASPVFCNGTPTYDGAVELAGTSLFADDFFANGNTFLTGAQFHTLELQSNNGAWSNSLSYVIYDDLAGKPGTIQQGGTVAGSEVIKTNLGTPGVLTGSGLVEFSYAFDFTSVLMPAAGNYWLALFLDSPNVNWVRSDGTFGAKYAQGPTSANGPWNNGTYNLTFAISGYTTPVPAPGVLALLLIGLAGVIGGRKFARETA